MFRNIIFFSAVLFASVAAHGQTFDEACYLNRYPDVVTNWVNSGGRALDHWNTRGQFENRIPGCTNQAGAPVSSSAFNEGCYLQRYPDVAQNIARNGGTALDHWNRFGRNEGRIPGCGGGIQPIAGPAPRPPTAPAPAPAPPSSPVVVTNQTIIGTGPMPVAISIDGQRFGGAVASVNWNSKEFINIHDHGRQLQSAMQVDGYAECNNPTEAGSEHDGTGRTSTSIMTGFNRPASNVLLTQANMAYWNWRTTTGACVRGKDPRVNTPVSNHLLNKRIQIGDLDDPRIIKYDVQFQHPAGSYREKLTYEFLTGYLTPEFNQYWYIQSRGGGLQRIDASSYIDITGNGFPPGSFHAKPAGKGHYDPIILSNASGSHAMGVYVPQSQLINCKSSFHGYGMYYFALGGSGPSASGTSKWSLAVDDAARSSCIRNNQRSFVVYLAVGTVAEVHQSILRAIARVK